MPAFASRTQSGMTAEDEFRFQSATPVPVAHDRHFDVFGDALVGGLWAAACQPTTTPEAASNLARRIEESMAECGDAVRVLLRSATGAVQVALAMPVVEAAAAHPAPEAYSDRDPTHARLAKELRELTGLTASALGAALGVTREQYQRWLAGGAISDARQGQLIYLHSIAADVLRRLGPRAAKPWWRTPVDGGPTPGDLVQRRQADRVYRLAASIPDPAPIVGGVIVGLPVQGDVDDNDVGDGGEAWSPYGDARPNS